MKGVTVTIINVVVGNMV